MIHWQQTNWWVWVFFGGLGLVLWGVVITSLVLAIFYKNPGIFKYKKWARSEIAHFVMLLSMMIVGGSVFLGGSVNGLYKIIRLSSFDLSDLQSLKIYKASDAPDYSINDSQNVLLQIDDRDALNLSFG